ncbi:hypothetical protein [Streptomyces malaysiensis]|uniref:hypothetical protein n=1 Tax=Streptomyces malaysiensis TaxID=92644 RepID=UPI00142ECA16|nr:hypothetical protein [Streptomyces malaysiensis]
MVDRSSNDLSGSVTGPVVQAGAVYGDIRIGATSEGASGHARALWEERVSAHRAFLSAADGFAKELIHIAMLLRSSLDSGDVGDWKKAQRRASVLYPLNEEVLKMYRGVTLVGPAEVSRAASAVWKELEELLVSLRRNVESKLSTASWEQEEAMSYRTYETVLALFTITARAYWESPPT